MEACEHTNCPENVFEYLITDAGPNMFTTRPCINSRGIGAMTAICVAAEKGNINAIRVFLRTHHFRCNGYHWPAVCAFRNNCGEIFDLLIQAYYSRDIQENPKFDLEYNFTSDFAVYRMIDVAVEENLDQSLRVIKKYAPGRSGLEGIEPWP